LNYFALGVIWPPLRAQLAHVAPGGGGLASLAGGRRGRAGQVTTDHLFFRLTLAKLRYSSTRRRHGPGSTYGFNTWVPLTRASERTANTRDVSPTDLSPVALHGTVQSASTWKNAGRASGGAYVVPTRSPPRCFSSQAGPPSSSSLKLYLVPATLFTDMGFGSPGRRKRIARRMRPVRCRTTRAINPAD